MRNHSLHWALGAALAWALAQGVHAAEPEAAVMKAPAIIDALGSKDVVLDRAGARAPARPRRIELQVQFSFDSARLLPQGKRQLDELALALNHRTLAATRFELAGHTDAVGSMAHNMQLSLQRAQAVKAYLVGAHLLQPQRLQALGLGASRPADPAHPEAAVNRRVEVRALPMGAAAASPHEPLAAPLVQSGGRLQATPR